MAIITFRIAILLALTGILLTQSFTSYRIHQLQQTIAALPTFHTTQEECWELGEIPHYYTVYSGNTCYITIVLQLKEGVTYEKTPIIY